MIGTGKSKAKQPRHQPSLSAFIMRQFEIACPLPIRASEFAIWPGNRPGPTSTSSEHCGTYSRSTGSFDSRSATVITVAFVLVFFFLLPGLMCTLHIANLVCQRSGILNGQDTGYIKL